MPYLDSAVPLAFAHRGFSVPGTAVENSLQAFRSAVELGFSYVETDLRTSSDGVLMVFHDEALDRSTDGRGKISEHTAEALARLRIGGTEPIPSFEQLVTAFPDLKINVDVKDAAGVAPLVEIIERYSLHERICVASFSDARRREVLSQVSKRTASSGGMLSIAAFVVFSAWLPRRWLKRLLRDVDGLQVPVRAGIVPVVTRKSVHRAHLLGLKMHVWTINEKAEMHRLFDLGVDGVMTDRADLLAEVMRERGYWN